MPQTQRNTRVKTGFLGQLGDAASDALSTFSVVDTILTQKEERNLLAAKSAVRAIIAGQSLFGFNILNQTAEGQDIAKAIMARPGEVPPNLTAAQIDLVSEVKAFQEGRELAIDEEVARGEATVNRGKPAPTKNVFNIRQGRSATTQQPRQDRSIRGQLSTPSGRESAAIESFIVGDQSARTNLTKTIDEARKTELAATRAEAKEQRDFEKNFRGGLTSRLAIGAARRDIGRLRIQGAQLKLAKDRLAFEKEKEANDLALAKTTAELLSKSGTITRQATLFEDGTKGVIKNRTLNVSQIASGQAPTQSGSVRVAMRDLNRIALTRGLQTKAQANPLGPRSLTELEQSISQGSLTAGLERAIRQEYPANSDRAVQFYSEVIQSFRATEFANLALNNKVGMENFRLQLQTVKALPVDERADHLQPLIDTMIELTGIPAEELQGTETEGGVAQWLLDILVSDPTTPGITLRALARFIEALTSPNQLTLSILKEKSAVRAQPTAPSASRQQVESDVAEFLDF